MRVAGALVAVLLVLSGCSASQGHARSATELPDVTLQPLGGGKPVDLSELRGPLVINLWASWCGPCRKELPQYQAFAQKYAGKVDVLGVDWQETRDGAALALARDTGVTYPLVTDPEGKLRAKALPKLILVDEDGEVASPGVRQDHLCGQLASLVQQLPQGARVMSVPDLARADPRRRPLHHRRGHQPLRAARGSPDPQGRRADAVRRGRRRGPTCCSPSAPTTCAPTPGR